MPSEIKTEEFERVVLQADRPTLVDFWGSWCIPCKQMEPILHELAAARPDVQFVKVNVNRNRPLVTQHRVMGVPSFVLFADGQERGRVVGAQTAAQLAAFIDRHLAGGD